MNRLALLSLAVMAGFASAQEVETPRIWLHAPAQDLLALYPERGAGFLISLDEFHKLLDLARRNESAAREQPPLPARLVRGAVTGKIDGDVLRLEASYVAVVSTDQPVEVPFPLEGVALESIHVEGGEWAGSALRFDEPGTYFVTATLSVRLVRERGLARAAFRLPPVAAHTVTLALPAAQEGEVGPIVRAFRTGDEGGQVVGFPDETGLFQLWIKPRAPARRLDPLLSARFDQRAEIGEARTLTLIDLDLEVLRAEVDRIDLLLDPGQTIRALTGKKVRSWRLARSAAGGDRLEIRLTEPETGRFQLHLESELARDEAATARVPIPRLPGAARYLGTLSVQSPPEIRLTGFQASGVRRYDAPAKGGEGLALFGVWSQEAGVVAHVERVAAKTQAFARALLEFREGGKSLKLSWLYVVAEQPLFRLRPEVPAGWILRSVKLDNAGVPHRYDEERGRLILDFPYGLKPGRHTLEVQFDTDEVDWVPNEGAVGFELAGIRSGLEDESGLFAVASDPAFRVGAGESTGLQAVGMPELQRAGFGNLDRILYAWRFERPGYAARFTLERHKPQIAATVTTHLLPSETLLKVRSEVRLDIQRTGVRELEVALPKGTGEKVEFKGALIKEKRAPAEADADPEVWTLVFQKRIRGAYRLAIEFDRSFESDTWTTTAPEIALPGVADRGFVVVYSAGTTAVEVTRDGLREADVGELPEQPPRPPLEVLAYGRHPYDVSISSRRHAPEAVVQAIALSAHIYGVLSPEGHLRCRAEYQIRNNDQPFLTFALPGGSTLLGALVDGEPAKPLVDGGALKLALPRSRGRIEPFAVALVYESTVEDLSERCELTLDRPGLDIDVLETRYTLHLPRGYELDKSDGDLVPLERAERPNVLRELLAMLAAPVSRAEAQGPAVTDSKRVPGRGFAGGEGSELREVGIVEKARSALEDASRPRAERRKAAAEKLLKEKRAQRRGPNGAVPPGMREPSDKEPPPAAPAEEPAATEDKLAFDEEQDQDFRGRPENSFEVAHGEKGAAPTPKPEAAPPARRKRPERALLSLDIEFLKPDNLVRLDSLAPTGRVHLFFARTSAHGRLHMLGIVLGAAAGAALFFARRFSLLRVLPAAVLLVLALHFAGLSLLAPAFALGAAQALAVVFLLALLVRLVRVLARAGRWLPRRRVTAGTVLLLGLASTAHAGEEVLVPYAKDPDRVDRVFLPADEYHALRRLAYPETAGRATAFARADYTARLAGDEVTVAAEYGIVKETTEAERIPLRLNDVAVTSATLDGEPATLTVEPRGGYVLVLQGRGRRVLELELRPRLERRGDTVTFSVPVVPVADAQLEIVHDRKGHKLDVLSLGGAEGALWHVGPVSTLRATWTPETAGFEAATAELRARTDTVVSVRDGYTGLAARIAYGISAGSVDRLRVRVGRDLTLRSVACRDLAGWQIAPDGTLVVALSKPAERGLVLTVLAERPAKREREESMPEIEPLGVLRDAGVIALETLPDLKLELLESQGLLRGRAAQAPRGLTAAHDKGVLHSVHRFAVRPFKLRWRVFLEQTRLRARTELDLFVDEELSVAEARLGVEVERGPGPFTIAVALPGGDWEVVTAGGPELRDWWVRDNVLVLDRLRRQRGSANYRVVLRRRGATASTFDAPALQVRGAARESGRIRVAVADGRELEVAESANLLPEDVARAGSVRWGRLVRAFRFVSVPWRLSVRTREEEREMEALVVSRMVPLADRVRVEALVNFHVRRGLVDRLSFVVPVADEGAVLISAPDLREERSEPVEGGRRYTLLLRTPTRGSASANVAYFLPYGEPLRGVEPEQAGRVRRFVAVEKIPDGEVRIRGAENLETGGFDDLPLHPPETTPQTVARVFVGSGGPFALTLDVKRHSFEEVAKAVIYRAAAKAVVDRSGWTRVEVGYRVYNRSKQFLRLHLPAGARLYSVLVAGEGVRPLGESGDLLVPLRKLALGSPTFDVDLLYAYRGPPVGSDDFEISLPDVAGIEVRRTTLSVWVPKGFDYDFEGEMETAEESDIAAGEATDLYQEIKELYSVAERGNELQAQRATDNFNRLEQEAQRVMDRLRAQTRNRETLKQIDVQQRALDALKKDLRQQSKNQVVAGVARLDAATSAAWDANRAYLEANKGREESEQVVAYLARNARAQQADTGAAAPQPQGGGSGGGAAGHAVQSLDDLAVADTPALGQRFQGPSTNSTIGIGGGAGGGYGGRFFGVIAPQGPADRDETGSYELAKADEGKRSWKTFGSYGTVSLGETDFRPPIIETYRRTRTVAPGDLRSARGRISLRIDLPREGEVYHFARLGARGGMTFSASERDGRWLEGLVALACAAGAVFVLSFRPRRRAA